MSSYSTTMTLQEFEAKFNEFDPLADHAPLTLEQARALAVNKAWLFRTRGNWPQGAGVVKNVVNFYDRVPITAALAEVTALRTLVGELVEGLSVCSETLRAIRMCYGFGSSQTQTCEQQMALESEIDKAWEPAKTLIAKAKEQVK